MLRAFSFFFVLVAAFLTFAAPALAETAPVPVYGPADIDGNDSEWLSDPVFSEMYEAGDPSKELLANAYVRYDCSTNTAYVRVDSINSDVDISLPDDQWVKIDSDKKVDATDVDNDAAPDFAYYGVNGNFAKGWEASFALGAPGDYAIEIHSQIAGDRTSRVADGTRLVISCPPTIATLLTFRGKNVRDGIRIKWETGTEMTLVGFEIFRSESPTGPFEKIKDRRAKNPGGITGGVYRFKDLKVKKDHVYFYQIHMVVTEPQDDEWSWIVRIKRK